MDALTRADVTVINTDMPGDHPGHWWHIKIGDGYYVVSAVDLLLGGFPGFRDSETMAFPADAAGEVTDWGEVGFVPYKDHEGCISSLLDGLNEQATS